MNPGIGKILIYAGLGFAILGLIILLFGEKLSWLGRLPGDIRIEKKNFKFYFPITTMILISIVASLLLHFVRKLF